MKVVCNDELRGDKDCVQYRNNMAFWLRVYEGIERLYGLYEEAKSMNDRVEIVCSKVERIEKCIACIYEKVLRNFDIKLDDAYGDIFDFDDVQTYLIEYFAGRYVVVQYVHRGHKIIEIRDSNFEILVALWKKSGGELKVIYYRDGIDVIDFISEVVAGVMVRESN